jgi:hypothetical protein
VGTGSNDRDARKKPRQHFHRAASLLLSKNQSPIPCEVENISEGGARLKFLFDGEFPPEFFLMLTANGSTHRRCRLVWREGAMAGVAFLTGPVRRVPSLQAPGVFR